MPAQRQKKNAPAPVDAGAEQVQDAVEEAESKGYIGSVPDQPPNEAFSLQTGPDSPTIVADSMTRVVQPTSEETS